MIRLFAPAIERLAGRVRGHPDLAAVCFLCLLSFLVHGKGLIPGRVLSPAELLLNTYPWRASRSEPVRVNPILGDLVVAFHPFQIFAAREIGSGNLPLWNPLTFGGAPFLANMQSGLFCPFNFPSYLLGFKIHLALSLIMKSAVAGGSMYWFLRLLHMGCAASLMGSVAFMFSGFITVWLGWAIGSTGVWFPLLFALVERIREKREWRFAAWLGIAVCVQFMGGHPETSFHMLIVVCAWVLFRAGGPGTSRFVVLSLCGMALGALLAAVQLIPFLEYVSETAIHFCRSTEPVAWTIGIRGLMAFIIPFYFWDATRGSCWDLPDFDNSNEMSGAVGIVPLILLPCVIFGGWRRRGAVFFAAAAVLSALVIYGNPAAELLSRIPWFGFAVNSRLLLVVSFSLAVLSAISVEVMQNSDEKARRVLKAGLIAVSILLLVSAAWVLFMDSRRILEGKAEYLVAGEFLIFVALLVSGALAASAVLRKPRGEKSALCWLLAVEIASVLAFSMRYYPSMKAGEFLPTTPALAFLKGAPGYFRALLPVPNAGMPYGIPDVQGYDGMSPRRVDRLLRAGVTEEGCGSVPVFLSHDVNSRLLDVLNVKYLLLPPDGGSPGDKYVLEYDGPDARIYRNRQVLDRAFLVPCARAYLSDDSAFDAVNRGALDFGREVALVDPAAVGPIEMRCSPQGVLLSGEARIVKYETQEVRVEVLTAKSAYLVLMDTYFPGWRATVNGARVEILRANYAFRAVKLAAGRHEVVFEYAPISFKAGVCLSLAGVVIAGFMFFAFPRKRL